MNNISNYNIGDIVTPSKHFFSVWKMEKFSRTIIKIENEILILDRLVMLPNRKLLPSSSFSTKAFHYSHFNLNIKKIRKNKLQNICNEE